MKDFKQSYRLQETFVKSLRLLDDKSKQEELDKLGDFKDEFLMVWSNKI